MMVGRHLLRLIKLRPVSCLQHTDAKTQQPQQNASRPYNVDSPPVLFIAKYGRLVDTTEVNLVNNKQLIETVDKECFPTKLTEESLSHQKIQFVLNAVKHTKTYEALSERLSQPHSVAYEPPLLAPSPVVVNGEETVEGRDDQSRLVHLENAEVTQIQWSDMRLDLRKLPTYYLMLSKSRLTALVCITSAAGYGLASSAIMAFDPTILILSTVGVGMTSAAANAINQFLEVPFDSQMNRTKNRVLVRGLISPLHALTFAAVSGSTGVLLLYNWVNGTAAALALLNLALYTSVYTPLKRVSIVNTWVGSVVGAIPPLIGWASATGHLDAGALVLGGILYAWQFPHFNSLSWNLRPDYSKAGYRMMSVTNPDLCKRVAFRHSLLCTAVCSVAAPLLEVTTPAFAVDSLPLNMYLIYLSWNFMKNADSSSSRKLFRYTLIHLPLLMLLMFVSRKRKHDPDSPDTFYDTLRQRLGLNVQ